MSNMELGYDLDYINLSTNPKCLADGQPMWVYPGGSVGSTGATGSNNVNGFAGIMTIGSIRADSNGVVLSVNTESQIS